MQKDKKMNKWINKKIKKSKLEKIKRWLRNKY